MKQEYTHEYTTKTGARLLDKPALKLYIVGDEPEFLLVGKNGYIYKCDESQYVVVCDSPYVWNKYFPNNRISVGEEDSIKVDYSEALVWYKRLYVVNRRSTQLNHLKNKQG